MGINSILLAGGGLGLAVVVSLVSGIGGATKSLQRNATDSAVKMAATKSASDLKAEKADHAKQLATLINDQSTVIFTTRQISAASTKGGIHPKSAQGLSAKISAKMQGEGLTVDAIIAAAIPKSGVRKTLNDLYAAELEAIEVVY